MDSHLIQKISKQVYQQYPEVAGQKPRVRAQRAPQPKTPDQSQTYLLTYRATAVGPGGKTFPRLVRVVANPQGVILKISSSKG